ncbi:hypothetical protein [Myxococcus landrumensis]|uniref:Uncharacterized protein n=1 Tax=Myxococcus landrumensis TaxID=2813577 RepID=A0ABX7N5P7_9BACT|nr:hypothetical protein [Myxococcus landrumus]QSQ13012.1 hypothetical protein JY572_32400 [Myxococcus landrumus]
MFLSRILRTPAVLLSLLALTPTARAAAETPLPDVPYVFVTVDSYLVYAGASIEVTGLLLGENTPRTLIFSGPGSTSGDASQHMSRCDRMALLTLSKPGAYRFEVMEGMFTSILTCRLMRTATVPAP